MTLHTVLGASGTIGRRLVAHLLEKGESVNIVRRNNPINWSENLGHVYYCIGVTADFRTRLHDTAMAHVHLAQEVLERAKFQSFLYISSTRVYSGAVDTKETAALIVNPNSYDDYYNLSKLMGESICLTHPDKSVRVVRVSNLIGADIGPYDSQNFFDSVLMDVIMNKRVSLRSSPESVKDYLDIDDAVGALFDIAMRGQERIYNVARGENTSTADLLKVLRESVEFDVIVMADAPLISFPPVDVSRLKSEFGFLARPLASSVRKSLEFAIRRGSHETAP